MFLNQNSVQTLLSCQERKEGVSEFVNETLNFYFSEGEILSTPAPAVRPQIKSGAGGNLKQYETEVATPELVGTLLSDLGRPAFQ